MMDPLCVVERYCERNKIKLELLPDNSTHKSDLFKRDDVMRITKLSKELQRPLPDGLVPLAYMEYNGNPQCLEANMDIVRIINICKEITAEYTLNECCVCFELCRTDIFKCARCVNITCNKCLLHDCMERNRDYWESMLKMGCSKTDAALKMCSLEKKCPVCRGEHGY